MKRQYGSRLVLISGLESLQLGIPRACWRGRPEVNIDAGYIDRRRYERALREARTRRER